MTEVKAEKHIQVKSILKNVKLIVELCRIFLESDLVRSLLLVSSRRSEKVMAVCLKLRCNTAVFSCFKFQNRNLSVYFGETALEVLSYIAIK